MQTPHPDTYPVIQKKLKFSVTRCFLDILRLKVGSLQWLGLMLPRRNCLNFIFSNYLSRLGKMEN
jgi:hypothetical protein